MLPIEVPVSAKAGASPMPAGQGECVVDHTAQTLGACPDCGSGQLVFEEGCKRCHVCGFSEWG